MARTGENIYKRKDGRWEGRYHIGRKSNGRLRYGYIYGKTYREVKEKLEPLKKKIALLSHYQVAGGLTYQQWINQWTVEMKATVKDSTFSSYSYKINRYLLPHLKETPLHEINGEQLKKMVQTWLDEGLSVSSIKIIVGLLSKSLKNAEQMGKIEKNPCINVMLPKAKKKKVRALSKREQRKLEHLAERAKSSKALSVVLAMHTGMRIGEISALRWENILFDQNLIMVENTYQRLTMPDGQKTKMSYSSVKSVSSLRVIPMSKKIREALMERKKHATDDYVFSVNGKPCEPRLLTYHFHRLRKKANLGQIHFHQLRHTFATRCLESGADIPSVSALLGHASSQMTLDVYSDSMLTQRIVAISSMEKAIS
ncbi:tyrosine-type recombinase/integrase [Enterococcus sp. AZ163]|uniref:tyrosine-type recombinase/integrase n=1 Tax=Enterococcus sp. AZ163 TaxID=2774638 RepID=UPI003D2BBC36